LSREPANYHYTNQGSTETLSERNDYKTTSQAFKAFGFSQEEINTIWRTVAAILHLGNVEFSLQEDEVIITTKSQLKTLSKLLMVTDSEAATALTQRVIAAHGDIMKKQHDRTQAEYGRDAFAKAIYERLFKWIVERINKAIEVPNKSLAKRFNRVIGVVDIYGFEIFDQNGFQQVFFLRLIYSNAI
jgi:myosin I